VTRGALPGYAAHAAPRSWTPLALTLGLHLLLVLAWLSGARGGRLPDAPQRAFTFVLLQPPAPPTRAPRLDLPLPPPLPLPRSRLPASIHTPAPVPVSATASTPDAETASAPQADPAPAAAEALPGDLLKSSRAMAGRIDRELRKGASPISAEPERKWERFAEAFAAARKGGDRTVTLDSYKSPDGVIIYRKTVGGRSSCYRTGSVGGLVTGFGNADLHGASIMDCPRGLSWTRH
jgi:hypothetical protein